jgi:hypothetical protein
MGYMAHTPRIKTAVWLHLWQHVKHACRDSIAPFYQQPLEPQAYCTVCHTGKVCHTQHVCQNHPRGWSSLFFVQPFVARPQLMLPGLLWILACKLSKQPFQVCYCYTAPVLALMLSKLGYRSPQTLILAFILRSRSQFMKNKVTLETLV